MPRFLRLLACLMVLPLHSAAAAADQGAEAEYRVKALYIGSLMDYFRWPAEHEASNPGADFKLGLLGDCPFGKHLKEAWSTQKIRNKTVRVKYSTRIQDLLECHAIFICESEAYHLSAVLKALEDKSIVTLGDKTGFAASGVMVNFYWDLKHIRFEMNPRTIRAAKLQVNSSLLKLATIVE